MIMVIKIVYIMGSKDKVKQGKTNQKKKPNKPKGRLPSERTIQEMGGGK